MNEPVKPCYFCSKWGFCHECEAKNEERLDALTAAYRGEGLSFEDDGSPEHDD